jgi:hypothetical protein
MCLIGWGVGAGGGGGGRGDEGLQVLVFALGKSIFGLGAQVFKISIVPPMSHQL